jgi:predicted cupin superfamily sugar epimerase
VWNFFEGAPLTIHLIDPSGRLIKKGLGNNLDKAESFQPTQMGSANGVGPRQGFASASEITKFPHFSGLKMMQSKRSL